LGIVSTAVGRGRNFRFSHSSLIDIFGEIDAEDAFERFTEMKIVHIHALGGLWA